MTQNAKPCAFPECKNNALKVGGLYNGKVYCRKHLAQTFVMENGPEGFGHETACCDKCGVRTPHYHIGFVDGAKHFRCWKCCDHPGCLRTKRIYAGKEKEAKFEKKKHKWRNSKKKSTTRASRRQRPIRS